MKILVAAALAFVGAILLLALRAPDVFASPQMWAEDAMVFWLNQYLFGWRAFVIPYAGYIHAAPRITAFLASFFDVAHAPRLYSLAALVLTGWSAATAASSVRPPLMGVLLGVSLVLAPHAGGEIFGTITNIQWLLAPTLALILLAPRSDHAPVRLNQSAFAAIAGLTGPFSILLLPVAGLRLFRLRDDLSLIVIVTGLVQLAVLIFRPPIPVEPGPGVLSHLAEQLILRGAGPRAINIAAAAVLVVASLLVRRHWTIRAGLIFLAAVTLSATFVKFLASPNSFDPPLSGPRYFYPCAIALIWCAISLLFTDTLGRIVGAAWIALAALTYPGGMFVRTPLADMQWGQKTRGLGERQLTIPINPPGWQVIVPARR